MPWRPVAFCLLWARQTTIAVDWSISALTPRLVEAERTFMGFVRAHELRRDGVGDVLNAALLPWLQKSESHPDVAFYYAEINTFHREDEWDFGFLKSKLMLPFLRGRRYDWSVGALVEALPNWVGICGEPDFELAAEVGEVFDRKCEVSTLHVPRETKLVDLLPSSPRRHPTLDYVSIHGTLVTILDVLQELTSGSISCGVLHLRGHFHAALEPGLSERQTEIADQVWDSSEKKIRRDWLCSMQRGRNASSQCDSIPYLLTWSQLIAKIHTQMESVGLHGVFLDEANMVFVNRTSELVSGLRAVSNSDTITNWVIGLAVGLKTGDIVRFLTSIVKACGSSVPRSNTDEAVSVVLFVGHGEIDSLLQAPALVEITATGRSRGVDVHLVPAALRRAMAPHQSRFEAFLEWMEGSVASADIVLLTDVRDVIFQGDPFLFARACREAGTFSFIYFSQEAVTFNQSRLNLRWIHHLYGADVANTLSMKMVSCSGVTLGSADYIRIYLENMVRLIAKIPRGLVMRPMDQGPHNYIVHVLKPFRRYFFVDNEDSIIYSMHYVIRAYGHVGTLPYEVHGPCAYAAPAQDIHPHGFIPPVIHQYDRNEGLVNMYHKSLERWMESVRNATNELASNLHSPPTASICAELAEWIVHATVAIPDSLVGSTAENVGT